MAETLPSGSESLRLAANEITLHAVAAGPADGPVVILLHGFPEFWFGWRHQIGLREGTVRTYQWFLENKT